MSLDKAKACLEAIKELDLAHDPTAHQQSQASYMLTIAQTQAAIAAAEAQERQAKALETLLEVVKTKLRWFPKV